MGLLLSAIAPIVLYLVIIQKIDKHDPEPRKLLWKLWLLGAISTLPIIVVEMLLKNINPSMGSGSEKEALYMAFIVAAFTEETFKYIFLKMGAMKSRAFDERLDGIVYAVFVALGFAAVENVLYVVSNDMSVAVIRSITAVPGHMLFGITMGYYISKQRFAQTRMRAWYASVMALVLPILVHGIYDYILMSSMKWLLIFFIPYMFLLWFFGIKNLRKYYLESKAVHEQAIILDTTILNDIKESE